MVDYEKKELFRQGGIDKQLVISSDDESIKITNNILHSQNFELKESLCSQDQLVFGSCEASSVSFRVSNIVSPLKNKWLNISIFLDGDTDNGFSIGRYKVNSDKPTADRKYRDIIAYDAMYDIINSDVSNWYNTLLPDKKSTTTLKKFRDSFFSHFGITQQTIELSNDSMVIEKTIDPSELSGKTVVNAICEISGCFGHINRQGIFCYVFLDKKQSGLYPRNDLYPADDLFPIEPKGFRVSRNTYRSCQYEDFVSESITKLQIRKEENDIGVSVGTDGNTYVIEDNFLVYGKSTKDLTSIANNILSAISNIRYRPFSAVAIGDPCLEVGDAIRLSTMYELVESYILQRTLKGIQSLTDTYTSTGKDKYSENSNSVRKSIVQLKGKTNILTRTIEETQLTMADIEKNLQAQITVNANGLTTKVSKNNVVSEINQSAETITIKASKIDLEGIVTADEFVSNYATIASLNAQKARIDTIAANYISASTVAANYATIASLNTTNATVSGKLDANQFTAQNISAMNITVKSANVEGGFSASKITSGQLSANRIDVGSFSTKDLKTATMDISGSGYKVNGVIFAPLVITVDGKTYYVLGHT